MRGFRQELLRSERVQSQHNALGGTSSVPAFMKQRYKSFSWHLLRCTELLQQGMPLLSKILPVHLAALQRPTECVHLPLVRLQTCRPDGDFADAQMQGQRGATCACSCSQFAMLVILSCLLWFDAKIQHDTAFVCA